ncbi:MAG: pitrilysin family protein [Myxococcota bacterium]
MKIWPLTLVLLSACASAPPPAEAPPPAAAQAPEPPVAPWQRTAPPEPLAAIPRALDRTTQHTLGNGLRLVVIEHKKRPVISVRLFLPSGSAMEPENAAGAAYLAIALLGDGYEVNDLGKPLVDEKSFRTQVAKLGGRYSFTVSHDAATLGIDGYSADAKRYLDMLASALIRPRLGEETFAARRENILDILEDAELSDDSTFFEFLGTASFGAGHVYARPIYGTLANIPSLALEEVRHEQHRLVTPKGATLVVVGDVSAASVVAMVESAFGPWKGPPPEREAVIRPPPVTKRSAVGFIQRLPSTTLLVCATRPLSDVKGQDEALDVLAEVLGHGAESRLGTVLREENGLTYGAYAEIVRRRFARTIVLCSRLKGTESETGVRLFLSTLEALRQAPPSDEEVLRARAVLIGEAEGSRDEVGGLMSTTLNALLTGVSEEQRIAALKTVAPEAVQALARKVLEPSELQILMAGEPSHARVAIKGNKLGNMKPLKLGAK